MAVRRERGGAVSGSRFLPGTRSVVRFRGGDRTWHDRLEVWPQYSNTARLADSCNYVYTGDGELYAEECGQYAARVLVNVESGIYPAEVTGDLVQFDTGVPRAALVEMIKDCRRAAAAVE